MGDDPDDLGRFSVPAYDGLPTLRHFSPECRELQLAYATVTGGTLLSWLIHQHPISVNFNDIWLSP